MRCRGGIFLFLVVVTPKKLSYGLVLSKSTTSTSLLGICNNELTPPFCYLGKKRPPPLFRSKKSVLFLGPMCLKYCHGNHKPPKTGLLHDLIQFGLSFLCYSGRFCIENWPNFHFNKKIAPLYGLSKLSF